MCPTTNALSNAGCVNCLRIMSSDCPESEFEAGFTSRVGQCRHPAMKCISSTVKNDLGDSLFFRSLADQLTDGCRVFFIAGVAARSADFLFQAVGGDKSHSRIVVDNLCIDVSVTAENGKPGATAGATADPFSNAMHSALSLFLKPFKCIHNAFVTFTANRVV